MLTKQIASLILMAGIASCTVGGEPEEDAVAGDGLGDEDREGTKEDGVGTLSSRVCADGETQRGIDVSKYQGTIDWNRVRNAGVTFAFIRVSDGVTYKDPKFASNWTNAKAAGVIRGAYQFFRPAQSVTAQANLFLQAIGTYQPGDLPPVIDVEATGGLSPSQIASRVRQWVDIVEQATGVTPIVYTGKYFWRDEVGGPASFEPNPLWIAQYTSKCPDIPSPWTRWMFWQHSDRGRVDGIQGNVDVNKFNGTLADLRAFAAGTQATAAQAPLPFHWVQNDDATYTFVANAPSGVSRIELRVDDYLIGAADGGTAQITHTFSVEDIGRIVDVRGYDSGQAIVARGNGLIDTTPGPGVFAEQTGESEYEIGSDDPLAATVEVFADDFPLQDLDTGRQQSTRGAVRYKFSQTGDRALRVITRDPSGGVIDTQYRTLHVR
jgi:lysozyme